MNINQLNIRLEEARFKLQLEKKAIAATEKKERQKEMKNQILIQNKRSFLTEVKGLKQTLNVLKDNEKFINSQFEFFKETMKVNKTKTKDLITDARMRREQAESTAQALKEELREMEKKIASDKAQFNSAKNKFEASKNEMQKVLDTKTNKVLLPMQAEIEKCQSNIKETDEKIQELERNIKDWKSANAKTSQEMEDVKKQGKEKSVELNTVLRFAKEKHQEAQMKQETIEKNNEQLLDVLKKLTDDCFDAKTRNSDLKNQVSDLEIKSEKIKESLKDLQRSQEIIAKEQEQLLKDVEETLKSKEEHFDEVMNQKQALEKVLEEIQATQIGLEQTKQDFEEKLQQAKVTLDFKTSCYASVTKELERAELNVLEIQSTLRVAREHQEMTLATMETDKQSKVARLSEVLSAGSSKVRNREAFDVLEKKFRDSKEDSSKEYLKREEELKMKILDAEKEVKLRSDVQRLMNLKEKLRITSKAYNLNCGEYYSSKVARKQLTIKIKTYQMNRKIGSLSEMDNSSSSFRKRPVSIIKGANSPRSVSPKKVSFNEEVFVKPPTDSSVSVSVFFQLFVF